MTARLDLEPIQNRDWPTGIEDMRAGFAEKLNVYRTMAHHPALLRAWADLREHVVNQTALGPVRSEVVILRTSVRLNCSYEWDQHILRARKRGISDRRIASMRGSVEAMDAEDAILAKAVDELLDSSRLSDETQATLGDLLGKAGVLDLIATVGFYATLGFILNSADTPLDDDVRAELDARPLDNT